MHLLSVYISNLFTSKLLHLFQMKSITNNNSKPNLSNNVRHACNFIANNSFLEHALTALIAIRCHVPLSILPTAIHPLAPFYSVTRPDITISDYIQRLVLYSSCYDSTYAYMLIFIDRIINNQPNLNFGHYSMHRVIITALSLAIKTLDPQSYCASHCARVGGITLMELNRLHTYFQTLIRFEVAIVETEYRTKMRTIQVLMLPNSCRRYLMTIADPPHVQHKRIRGRQLVSKKQPK